MMGVFLFNKAEQLIKIVPPEDCFVSEQDLKLNDLIHHDIEIAYSDDLEEVSKFGMHDIDDPNNFLLYKITRKVTQDGITSVAGIHVFFDDLKGGVVRDIRPNGGASSALAQILDGSRWQVGISTTTKSASSNFYYLQKNDAFWKFLKEWGVEFKLRMNFVNGQVSTCFVDIADMYAPYHGKWYEIGDSLLTIVAEEEHSNIFTAFLGRGKGEEVGEGYGRKITFEDIGWSVANGDPVDKPVSQDFVEIPWATTLYGYANGTPRIGILDFPDVEDKAELLQKTYEAGLLNCVPKRQFKASVEPGGIAEPGEIVSLIDDSIGVRYQARIFRLKRDFLNRNNRVFEFGEKLVRSQAERIRLEREETTQRFIEQELLLDQVRNEVIQSYFNEDGYNYELRAGNDYELPAGLYSFNAPIDQNPTKVIYFGAGKFLIANSKLPNGNWNWRTAGDGDGLVADVITTGTLNASLVKAGVLSDVLGRNSINLESGAFSLGNGDISYNPTTGKTLVKDAAIDTLSANKLSAGTIDALNIRIKNQNLSEFVRGMLPISTAQIGFSGSSPAEFKMTGTGNNFGANSSYVKINDTGGRGQVLINGTLAATGSSYFWELNTNGLFGGASLAGARQVVGFDAGQNLTRLCDPSGTGVFALQSGSAYYKGRQLYFDGDVLKGV